MEGPDSLVCKSIVSPEAEVSVTKREVTSYKAMFHNIDRVREIVDPGAFLDSIGPNGRLAKGQVTTRHNHKDLVGKMIHAEETREGLLTVDKYGVDPVSDRVFSLVRDGIITTSSFQARYAAKSRVKAKGLDGEPVFHLTRLDLIEAGPADPDFAVNPETRVVAVKGLGDVAAALSRMDGLDSQERFTLEGLSMLDDEEKDSLLALLDRLPVGPAVQELMAVLRGEQASEKSSYDEAIGKAFELTELYRASRFDGLLERISNSLTKCRPSAATN